LEENDRLIKRKLLSDLTDEQIPPTIEEAINRVNTSLMVCAIAEVLEEEGGVEYYRDLLDRIQYLLRGYDFNGKCRLRPA
jgi:hypothetical protein